MATSTAADVNPAIVLMFRDTGFDGPEFRTLTHHASVKWVHVSGSGYEHILPLERDDLLITNGQGLRSRNLAEMAVGAMISINSGLIRYHEQQRNKRWQPNQFVPLEGQTLLLVGTGLIGRWVAHYARTLGMRVIGVNRSGTPVEAFDDVRPMAELDDILPLADVVSLHLRLNDDTRGLFNRDRFKRMRTGTLFMNTARGGLVDESALIDALHSGQLRAAYLDVFETEPLPEYSPLWSLENVLISPHAADMISDWEYKAAEFFVENYQCWKSGKDLINVIHMPSA